MDSEYEKFVVTEENKAVRYVHVLKALNGMLVSAMLFHKRLKKDLIEYGFKVKPQNLCVANKIITGRQWLYHFACRWLKVSHIDPNAMDEFLVWIKETYAIKKTWGNALEYLVMKLDYSQDQIKIDMVDYVKTMVLFEEQKFQCHSMKSYLHLMSKFPKLSKEN